MSHEGSEFERDGFDHVNTLELNDERTSSPPPSYEQSQALYESVTAPDESDGTTDVNELAQFADQSDGDERAETGSHFSDSSSDDREAAPAVSQATSSETQTSPQSPSTESEQPSSNLTFEDLAGLELGNPFDEDADEQLSIAIKRKTTSDPATSACLESEEQRGMFYKERPRSTVGGAHERIFRKDATWFRSDGADSGEFRQECPSRAVPKPDQSDRHRLADAGLLISNTVPVALKSTPPEPPSVPARWAKPLTPDTVEAPSKPGAPGAGLSPDIPDLPPVGPQAEPATSSAANAVKSNTSVARDEQPKQPPETAGTLGEDPVTSPDSPSSVQELELMTGTTIEEGASMLEALYQHAQETRQNNAAEALRIKRMMFKYGQDGGSMLDRINDFIKGGNSAAGDDLKVIAIWASAAAHRYRSERDQYRSDRDRYRRERNQTLDDLEDVKGELGKKERVYEQQHVNARKEIDRRMRMRNGLSASETTEHAETQTELPVQTASTQTESMQTTSNETQTDLSMADIEGEMTDRERLEAKNATLQRDRDRLHEMASAFAERAKTLEKETAEQQSLIEKLKAQNAELATEKIELQDKLTTARAPSARFRERRPDDLRLPALLAPAPETDAELTPRPLPSAKASPMPTTPASPFSLLPKEPRWLARERAIMNTDEWKANRKRILEHFAREEEERKLAFDRGLSVGETW